MAGQAFRLFVSAGEASGDALLAKTLKAIKNHLSGRTSLQLAGLGGPLSEGEGLKSLAPIERMGVNGVGDVLAHLPYLHRQARRIEKALQDFSPDAVFLIDYPGLNLRLLESAKALGLPVHFLAPPQLWARHESVRRAKRMKRLFEGVSVQVLFPFEAADYAALGADIIQGHAFDPTVRSSPSVGSGLLLLCPGSRLSVLRRNLPAWSRLLDKLSWPRQERLVLVPEYLRDEARKCLAETGRGCEVTSDKNQALAQAAWALCFPGTMTLELALAGLPFAGLGILDALTYALGKRMLKTPWLALPNVLLNQPAWPEWIGTKGGLSAPALAGLIRETQSLPRGQGGRWHDLHSALGRDQGPDQAAARILSLAEAG